MYACSNNAKDVVDLLLTAGAKVDQADKVLFKWQNIKKEYHRGIITHCNQYLYQLFIHIISRYTAQNGSTALMFACLNNAKDAVDLLLKAGAKVNQADEVLFIW